MQVSDVQKIEETMKPIHKLQHVELQRVYRSDACKESEKK